MHILVLVRWPSQEAVVCCCYCFYQNIFILLLISLLCNSQRLLGDPVTKQICVFPRRGNDPRTTVGIRTCLWSCSLQYKSTYLNIMSFCAVDCVYFVFLFVSLKIRKWSHCHLCFTCPWSSFIGSYFVHLNVLCSFTSVFMFSSIPHICHFFYTDRIFGNQILHPKKGLKAPTTLKMSLKK